MQVLIIGGGGREHALAWHAARSKLVQHVFVAPGNAGTQAERGVTNLPIAAEDIDALVAYAAQQRIDLTLVGPEAPLVAGIVDTFTAHGLACYGPSQAAARLEGSKTFSKDFLNRHHIPTARYAHFDNLAAALAHLDQVDFPLVVKADGLAAGKGVTIATEHHQAAQALHAMLAENRFGTAGQRVIIEEFIRGEEISYIVMSDGHTLLPLASSQDHKAAYDGDRGPNTGGMGAYSPAAPVDAALEQTILNRIMQPTIDAMAAEGNPYVGFLYAGLMLDPNNQPKVLEFNCRLGDPETQPLLLRLQSDLIAHTVAALNGQLHTQQTQWDPRSALGIVMAAAGYPGSTTTGHPIHGLPPATPDTLKIFHAATQANTQANTTLTSGGRVLCITALGDTLDQAQQRAYCQARQIHWTGSWYRRDIGQRAIARV